MLLFAPAAAQTNKQLEISGFGVDFFVSFPLTGSKYAEKFKEVLTIFF